MFGVIPRTLWSRVMEPDERNRVEVAHNCLLLERLDDPEGSGSAGVAPVPRKVLIETGSGDKLGQKIYYQLSKQQLVYGPNQIESRINQDQEIARDLTLWNQQGSRVLRGDILALPVDDAFLYVESIYIQAESARMPQLKKVVLAMGNRLVYEDTVEQALARLGGGALRPPPPEEPGAPGEVTEAAPSEEPEPSRGSRNLATRLSDLRKQAEDLARQLQQMERELEP